MALIRDVVGDGIVPIESLLALLFEAGYDGMIDLELIAAGAMIPPGKLIPDGSVVMGMPGNFGREVTERDLAMIEMTAAHYVARGHLYRQELTLDPRSVEIKSVC
jgi:hypothetical protein